MIILPLTAAVAAFCLLIASIVRRPRNDHSKWMSGERLALLVAVGWVALLSISILALPVYAGGRTLIGANGMRVLLVLVVPVCVAAVPFALPPVRPRVIAEAGATLLLAIFATFTGFSIGLLYLPAVLALLAATAIGFERYRGL